MRSNSLKSLSRLATPSFRPTGSISFPFNNHAFPKCSRSSLSANSRRHFLTSLPKVLVPPVMFLGLGIALWTWKCCMMIIFQNKIIYMPGLPPNARRETISAYAKDCCGVKWKEVRIKSLDNTELALCVAASSLSTEACNSDVDGIVYVLYLQGNASSLPPRLPFLSPIVRLLEDKSSTIRYVFICLNYRGYWTSQGRASEKGINKDAEATLRWIISQHEDPTLPASIVVWGQSIGSGFASTLVANHSTIENSKPRITDLILETPFTNIRDMLHTLYPQKWLPYQYLWPFLRNHLDSTLALRMIAREPKPPRISIIVAAKDELVPESHGLALEQQCMDLGLEVTRSSVPNALHTEVMALPFGRKTIAAAIKRSCSKSEI